MDVKLKFRLELEAPQAGVVTVPMMPLPPSWIFLSANPEPQIIVGNDGVNRIPGLLMVPIVTRWNTWLVSITPAAPNTELQDRAIPRMLAEHDKNVRFSFPVVSL